MSTGAKLHELLPQKKGDSPTQRTSFSHSERQIIDLLQRAQSPCSARGTGIGDLGFHVFKSSLLILSRLAARPQSTSKTREGSAPAEHGGSIAVHCLRSEIVLKHLKENLEELEHSGRMTSLHFTLIRSLSLRPAPAVTHRDFVVYLVG